MRPLYWWMVGELGVDFRRLFRAITGMPRFVRDLSRFRRRYSGPLSVRACLADWHEQAGVAGGEYFLQDLYVARRVHAAAPMRHMDVGSRIDGFVAHVASFREIDLLDIRPMRLAAPGISFRQADLMRPDSVPVACTDSLSCLHALEHFGLGRYGDTLDPDGHLIGFRSMAKMLAPGGTLYLSSPMGRARVAFNSHRVLDPLQLLDEARAEGLALAHLAIILSSGSVELLEPTREKLMEIADRDYTLTMLELVKEKGPRSGDPTARDA